MEELLLHVLFLYKGSNDEYIIEEEGFFKNKNVLKSIHYTIYGELICTNTVIK